MAHKVGTFQELPYGEVFLKKNFTNWLQKVAFPCFLMEVFIQSDAGISPANYPQRVSSQLALISLRLKIFFLCHLTQTAILFSVF